MNLSHKCIHKLSALVLSGLSIRHRNFIDFIAIVCFVPQRCCFLQENEKFISSWMVEQAVGTTHSFCGQIFKIL